MFVEPRKQLNDTIKLFVEYALKQESKNAKMYYTNIHKMINQHLFSIDSSKDILLNTIDKSNLNFTEMFVVQRLIEHMENGSKPYKQIYKNICSDIKNLRKKDAICLI